MSARLAEHGYGAYTRKKNPCRCEVCRKAKADYIRGRRAAGLEAPRSREFPRPTWSRAAPVGRGASAKRVGISRVFLPNLTKHGTRNGYRRGCRCWDCTDAATRANADYIRRRQSA